MEGRRVCMHLFRIGFCSFGGVVRTKTLLAQRHIDTFLELEWERRNGMGISGVECG